MSLSSRLAWREFRLRPSRPLLTLLSIVIGVAAVVAVSIAAGTSRRAFDAIFTTVAGRTDLEVTASVGTSFDEDVAAELRKMPGVEAVSPLMERIVALYYGPDSQQMLQCVALGIDPKYDPAVHDFELVAGKSLLEANGVMLEAGFAQNAGIKVGDRVDLGTRRGIQVTHVVGLFKPKGISVPGKGATLLMQLRAAQYLFKAPRKIDSAQIVLKEGADEKEVRAEIAKVLPSGVNVDRPASRNPVAEETSLSTELGMRMARFFSLLVAAVIITNTFLINVAQRRRQLGIMRAIGATRRQITGMLYREAFRMGLIGTVLGSLLGVVAARYLNDAMGTLYKTTLPPIQLTWPPFALGFACGLGISMLAAVFPAWRASRLSPLEAMRDVLPEEIEGTSWGLIICGLILISIGGGVMVASALGWLPMFGSVLAAVVLLLGLGLLLPLGLDPLSRLAAAALRPFAGVEGRLARLQLLRHKSRTTLTVLVMFLAIAAGIGLATAIINNVENVKGWYQKSIVADFFVRASAPEMASGLAADLPDKVGVEVERVPGIQSLDAVRFVSVKAAGERAILVARDHSSPEAPDLDIVSGDLKTLRQNLHDGEVALGSVLAQRAGLKVGDTITLSTDEGERKFRVAAVVNDYQAGGLTIHIERDVAKRELGVEGVDAYIIKADKSQLESVRDALQKIANDNNINLESATDIQKTIDRMMSGVVAALWAMVVLLLAVASVGVTNTLTINVLEQTREIGLLRVVAMTRAQVRKSIITQAMIIGLLALVPGILAGVAVSYLINLSTYPMTGHVVRFTLHPSLLVGSFAAGLFVVALAALLPADRAARLHLPTAMRMS